MSSSPQNPFGDFGPSPSGSNPYGGSSYQSYNPGPAAYFRPHRGGLVLTLGIVGLVTSFIGMTICMLPFGLILSIPAWVMGAADLKAIDRGEMDPTGRGQCQGGMITGIIGTVLGGLMLIGGIVFLVFIMLFVVGAASMK